MQLTEAIDTLSGLSQSDQKNVEAINLAISILQNSFQPELKELDDVKHSLATQQVRAETAEIDVSNKQQEINQHLQTIEQKEQDITFKNSVIVEKDNDIEMLNSTIITKSEEIDRIATEKENVVIEKQVVENELNVEKGKINKVVDDLTLIVEDKEAEIEGVKIKLNEKIKELKPIEPLPEEVIL